MNQNKEKPSWKWNEMKNENDPADKNELSTSVKTQVGVQFTPLFLTLWVQQDRGLHSDPGQLQIIRQGGDGQVVFLSCLMDV